jgi:DinB superfamily
MSDEITPDDKNWTWVLEKPCVDCGFDSAEFDVKRTGDAVRDQAVRWATVLQQNNASTRPRPGVWSPLEYGCHVRDVFKKFDERVQLMMSQIDPHFENWDQDKTAVDDDYGSQNLATVAQQLVEAAESLSSRFDSVSADQWQRRGFRSDGSVFTVESLARYLMHDPIHHLWDVGADVPVY